MSRLKSALIVFVGVAVAIIVALKVDYTNTYVEKRFHKALASGQYDQNKPFSLDMFLEYYDWDTVCVALPGSTMDLRTRGKLPYKLKWNDDNHWTLVFTKSYYVVAEIAFDRNDLEAPDHLQDVCYERWQAIIKIVDKGGVPKIRFVDD